MPILNQGFDYNVDVVMCIDATGSMSPILEQVKENALSFHQKFIELMENAGKDVQQLRIKVIAFRDYRVDSEPMVESEFFKLDEDSDKFHEFVSNIEADGGGDEPESALEALALAMKSDWVRTGAVRRHVIIMFTDASALPLGQVTDQISYPSDMPKDIVELNAMWEDGQHMENRAKRLLLFAPDADPWSNMAVEWTSTFHTASKAGSGCDETDMDTCISFLVASI